MLIDRYLTRQVVQPMLLGIGLFMLIFVGFTLAKQLEAAAEGIFDVSTALMMVGLSTIATLEVILPFALFFSILSVIGRLYQDGEIIALTAAGLSPLRMMRTVSVVALGTAVVVSLLSVYGRPWAYQQMYRLEARASFELDASRLAARNFVTIPEQDYVFIADDRDSAAGMHRSVFLHRLHDNGRFVEVVRADSAQLPRLDARERATTHFFDGHSYLIDLEQGRDVVTRFGEFRIVSEAIDAKQRSFRRKAAPTAELARSNQPREIAEYQWRLSTPLATFLLATLAVPLTRSQPRQSRLRPNLIAIGTYLLLFATIAVTRGQVETGRLPAVPGLWLAYLPPALLLLALLVTQSAPWAQLRYRLSGKGGGS